MTNKEKFKDEIIEIACTRDRLAVTNGKITSCSRTLCEYCDLKNEAHDCTGRLKKWLEEEYVDVRIMDAKKVDMFGGVSKGDKVLVSDDADDLDWVERIYLCTYKNYIVTANEESGIIMPWKYLKAPVKGDGND